MDDYRHITGAKKQTASVKMCNGGKRQATAPMTGLGTGLTGGAMSTIQAERQAFSGEHQLTQVAKNMCEVVEKGGGCSRSLLEDGDTARGDGRGGHLHGCVFLNICSFVLMSGRFLAGSTASPRPARTSTSQLRSLFFSFASVSRGRGIFFPRRESRRKKD